MAGRCHTASQDHLDTFGDTRHRIRPVANAELAVQRRNMRPHGVWRQVHRSAISRADNPSPHSQDGELGCRGPIDQLSAAGTCSFRRDLAGNMVGRRGTRPASIQFGELSTCGREAGIGTCQRDHVGNERGPRARLRPPCGGRTRPRRGTGAQQGEVAFGAPPRLPRSEQAGGCRRRLGGRQFRLLPTLRQRAPARQVARKPRSSTMRASTGGRGSERRRWRWV